MKNLLWIVALAAIFFVSEGCKQDNRVGFNLIEDDQLFSKADTVWNIAVKTIGRDTIQTDITSTVSLGISNDPIFGKTKAECAIQFNLSGTTPNYTLKDSVKVDDSYEYFYHFFGKNPKADSMFLILTYDTAAYTRACVMGDPNISQEIEVVLLNDTLAPVNYGHTNLSDILSNNVLATNTHEYKPENITHSIKFSNQMFVDTFLNNNTSAFKDRTTFRDVKFKGLALRNKSETPSFITRYNLSSAETKLRVYYSNDSVSQLDTTVYYDLKVDVGTNRSITYTRYFTQYTHDYSGSEIDGRIDSDDINDNGKIYIESLGGVRTLLTLPGVKEWAKDKSILIRNAQLIIRPIESDYNSTIPNLESLNIFEMEDNEKLGLMPEYYSVSTSGSSYSPEEYDSVDNEFRFDITSYVNGLKNNFDSEELGLVLSAQNSNFTFGRTTLHSANANASDYKMFVKISYSFIE